VEDGETFLENARKKALHYAAFTGLLTLADDSGLAVDALAGLPGVYSARYAHGEGSSDEENLNKVLKEISKIPDAQRQARFICAAAVAAPEKVIFETEQSVEGEITMEPAGEGGFGYDPIFYYPPFGKTLAQVSAEEKHAVSHRGKAMREVAAFLNSLSEFSTG
jgi:XTP/dITP diphosphohydrolase